MVRQKKFISVKIHKVVKEFKFLYWTTPLLLKHFVFFLHFLNIK